MNYTKSLRILCGSIFLLSMSQPVFAESGHDGPPKHREGHGEADGAAHHRRPNPERMVARLQKRLKLSDDQANAVFAALQDARSSRKACQEKTVFTERRDCRKQNKAVVETKIASLLTPEQQTKFKAMREKRKERRAKRKAGKGKRDRQSAN